MYTFILIILHFVRILFADGERLACVLPSALILFCSKTIYAIKGIITIKN